LASDSGHVLQSAARIFRKITTGFQETGGAKWRYKFWDMPDSVRLSSPTGDSSGPDWFEQAVERSQSLLAFQMDNRKQRIVIETAGQKRQRAGAKRGPMRGSARLRARRPSRPRLSCVTAGRTWMPGPRRPKGGMTSSNARAFRASFRSDFQTA
jgi:hypothetical protein